MATLRPHRFQSGVVRAILESARGGDAARQMMRDADVEGVPLTLASAPRDLDALAAELRPFSALYRALQARLGEEQALALMRQAILRSGSEAHAAMEEAQRQAPPAAAAGADGTDEAPLNVVSPPDSSFHMEPERLAAAFDRAMAFFACEGKLFRYDSDEVHFQITDCHWCRAMEREGTPHLIEFFCETDERFMDGHPTHRLALSSTIGRGAKVCDFRFLRRTPAGEEGIT